MFFKFIYLQTNYGFLTHQKLEGLNNSFTTNIKREKKKKYVETFVLVPWNLWLKMLDILWHLVQYKITHNNMIFLLKMFRSLGFSYWLAKTWLIKYVIPSPSLFRIWLLEIYNDIFSCLIYSWIIQFLIVDQFEWFELWLYGSLLIFFNHSIIYFQFRVCSKLFAS